MNSVSQRHKDVLLKRQALFMSPNEIRLKKRATTFPSWSEEPISLKALIPNWKSRKDPPIYAQHKQHTFTVPCMIHMNPVRGSCASSGLPDLWFFIQCWSKNTSTAFVTQRGTINYRKIERT